MNGVNEMISRELIVKEISKNTDTPDFIVLNMNIEEHTA